MRVAVFYPESLYSAWSCSKGFVDVMRRMGHEVADCPIVPDKNVPLSRKDFPKDLEAFDRVIVSGPEHIGNDVRLLYPDLGQKKVKKVGYLHETVRRSDYGKLPIEEIRKPFDEMFTPAKQDEEFGLKWLPFGVDVEMFKPQGEPSFDVGFVGLLYGKRQEWLREAKIGDLRMARVEATGPAGVDTRWSARLLAESYRGFKVFLNMPSLCEHLVTKVYEVMACGTALVTPFQDGEGRANFEVFENGKHLQYYSENPRGMIEALLNEPEYRKQMALRGMEEVREKHDLRLRCEVLLA